MSYNFGPLNDGLFRCELSDVSHLQASLSELEAKEGFIYSPIRMVSTFYHTLSGFFLNFIQNRVNVFALGFPEFLFEQPLS